MAEQTTAELAEEVKRLRQRIAELEGEQTRRRHAEDALRESEE